MFLKKAILFTNANLGIAFSNTVIVDNTINNNHTICLDMLQKTLALFQQIYGLLLLRVRLQCTLHNFYL